MTFDPTPHERAMWERVDAVDAAAERVRAAERDLEQARDAADDAMRAYGAARTIAELPLADQSQIAELYWRRTNVRVQGIADAFGIRSASMVHQHAGPGVATAACPAGCGREVRLPARTSSPRVCAACSQEREEESAARAIERDARALQERERIRERIRAGATPEQLLAEHAERWETNGPGPLYRQLAVEVLAEQTGRPLPT